MEESIEIKETWVERLIIFCSVQWPQSGYVRYQSVNFWDLFLLSLH